MPLITRANRFFAAFCLIAIVLALELGNEMVREQDALTPASAYERHDGKLEKLWRVPAFEAISQARTRVSERSLRGHVWIASFLFTSCTTVCPILARKLAMLQEQLPEPDLRFVSFSVDPMRDTPDRLATFAQAFRPEDEKRWLLLNAEPMRLERLVRGMRVSASQRSDKPSSISHSSLLFLVDRDGWVRGVYDSANSDGRSLGELAEAVRALQDSPRTSALGALIHSLSRP